MSDNAINEAPPRRRNTKERIIDEAEKLAAFHGIEHLKLQDVADKIGIKLPSVYAHFGGREDILAAMGARINRGFSPMFMSQSGETPSQTLHRCAQELTEFFGNNPAYFRLMLRDLSVPLSYDSTNRRLNVSHGNSVSLEMKAMQDRVTALISQIGSHSPWNGERFLSALIGTLLLSYSWIVPTVNEDGDVEKPNIEPLRAHVTNLVECLTRPQV